MSIYTDVKADVVRRKNEVSQNLRQWWQAKKQETRRQLLDIRQAIAEESSRAWRVTGISVQKSRHFLGSALGPIRRQGQAVKSALGQWVGDVRQLIVLPRVRFAIMLPLQSGIRLSGQSLRFFGQTLGPILQIVRHWVIEDGFPVIRDFTLAIFRGASLPLNFVGQSVWRGMHTLRHSLLEIMQDFAQFYRDNCHPPLAQFFHALSRDAAKSVVFVGRSLLVLGISTRDGVLGCGRQGKRLAIWMAEPIMGGVKVFASTLIAEGCQLANSVAPWFRDFGQGFVKSAFFSGDAVWRLGKAGVTAGIQICRGINPFLRHYVVPIYHASIDYLALRWRGFVAFSKRCLQEVGMALGQMGRALQQIGRVIWQLARQGGSDLVDVLQWTAHALSSGWRAIKPMLKQGLSAMRKATWVFVSAAYVGLCSMGTAFLAIARPTWRATAGAVKQLVLGLVMGAKTTASLIGETFVELGNGLWASLVAMYQASSYVLSSAWCLLQCLGKGALGFAKAIPKILGTALDCLLFICCLPCYAGRSRQAQRNEALNPVPDYDEVQIASDRDRDRLPNLHEMPPASPWQEEPAAEPVLFANPRSQGNIYPIHRQVPQNWDDKEVPVQKKATAGSPYPPCQ